MALEPPLRGDTVGTPADGVVALVDEEAAEHVAVAEVAEGLAGRAELDVVVRRRGGRAQEPVAELA
jgi:hypothetical protein